MTSLLQEDNGIIEIHRICVAMNAIWRPTPNHDLGIDGQIEFLEQNSNVSTGRIVAVQSKSGPSYFRNQNDECVKYYPADEHRRYWKKLKMPVILVLHNPDSKITLFTSVKPQLKNEGPIVLYNFEQFTPAIRDDLISYIVKDYDDFVEKSPAEIIERFARVKHMREHGKEITGIDFVLACTNLEKKFFEIRMCRIKSLFHALSENSGIFLCGEDYNYILRNVLQFHVNRMIPDILEEFDEVWYECNMVPDIIVPLTETGLVSIRYLWSNIDKYLNVSNYEHLKLSSAADLATHISAISQASSERIDASDRLAAEPR